MVFYIVDHSIESEKLSIWVWSGTQLRYEDIRKEIKRLVRGDLLIIKDEKLHILSCNERSVVE